MMIPTTHLFDLIKSLKQTEKRYFKVYASKLFENKENQYLKLFNAIDKMEAYDEAVLKRKFKDEAFIRQFHVIKNYLQSSIVKSLIAYHAETTANIELHQLLQSVEILFEKGLYTICQKYIERGIEQCNLYEKSALLNLFLEWEARILIRKSEYAKANELLKKMALSYAGMDTAIAYKIHAFSVYEKATAQGFLRDKEQLERLKSEFDSSLMTNKPGSAGTEETYYYLSALSLYYGIQNDIEKRLATYSEMAELLEGKPDFIHENPQLYISVLNNLCNILLRLNRAADALKVIFKMRRLIEHKKLSRREDARMLAASLSYNAELSIYLLTGNIEQIIALEPQVAAVADANESVIQKTNLLDLMFNMSYCLFATGKFDKALEWLNKIMNSPRMTLREDMQMVCRIYNLMIHYELNNMTLLQNIIASTERHLKNRGKLFESEKALLHFFKSELQQNAQGNKQMALSELKQSLKTAFQNPYESNFTNHIDIILWIDSKLEDKPYYSVIKDKHEKDAKKVLSKSSAKATA